MKSFLFFIWLFFLVFTPQFLIFGVVFNSLYLLIVPLFLIDFIKLRNDLFLNKLILILVIVLSFHFLISIYNGYLELSILKQIIIFFFMFLNFYYFFLKFKIFFPENTLYELFMLVLIVLVLNSLTILISAIYQPFTDFLYSIVYITEKQAGAIYETNLLKRFSGFSVSGFSYLSFKYMFLYIISISYFIKKDLKIKDSVRIILFSFIIIFSMIFVARTGLFFIFLFFLVFLLKKYFFSIRLKEMSLFFFIVFFVYNFIESSDSEVFWFAADRSFDLFFNYFNNSELENGTINDLSQELIFPKNLYHWILGNGDFGRDRIFVTDIGWLSFINGSGLVGVIIYYIPYFYLFIISLNSGFRFATVSLVLSSLIANSKDLVFLEHSYIQAFCIMFIILLWKKSNQLE